MCSILLEKKDILNENNIIDITKKHDKESQELKLKVMNELANFKLINKLYYIYCTPLEDKYKVDYYYANYNGKILSPYAFIKTLIL